MQKLSILIGCFVFLTIHLTGSASAQQMRGEVSQSVYFPYKNPPPLSAWLELERTTSSELDSYHQFVKPRLEMQRIVETQQRQLLRQKEEQQVLQHEVQRMQVKGSSTATKTGKGARFQYYGHYYKKKER